MPGKQPWQFSANKFESIRNYQYNHNKEHHNLPYAQFMGRTLFSYKYLIYFLLNVERVYLMINDLSSYLIKSFRIQYSELPTLGADRSASTQLAHKYPDATLRGVIDNWNGLM